MTYTINLPPFAPHALKLPRTAAFFYTILELNHKTLMDALNKGIYPESMGVEVKGMSTNYPVNDQEPAVVVLLRMTQDAAKDYCSQLTIESEQLAMFDYIASIESILLSTLSAVR